MSKSTQRKQSAFDVGRQYNRLGIKRDHFFNPYGEGFGLVFLAGFHTGYTKKTKVLTQVVNKIKTQTEKNRAKRQRKRLRKLYS